MLAERKGLYDDHGLQRVGLTGTYSVMCAERKGLNNDNSLQRAGLTLT